MYCKNASLHKATAVDLNIYCSLKYEAQIIRQNLKAHQKMTQQ